MLHFKEKIEPFFWMEYKSCASLCLIVGKYKAEIFQIRAEEGFEGNGYDWVSLAKAFIEEKMPELIGIIKFDPESSMFCAYSSNVKALETFALSFKKACENEILIKKLLLKMELD